MVPMLLAFPQHRHAQNASDALAARSLAARREIRRRSAEWKSCTCTGFRSSKARPEVRVTGCDAAHFSEAARYPAMSAPETCRSSPSFRTHDSVIGLAKLAGAFDDRLEDRLDVGRRAS